MKEKTAKKLARPLFSLIICLTLILSLFTVTAFATDTNISDDESEYHEFFMAEDESYIYDSEDKYKAYKIPLGYHLCDNKAYVFANPIDIYDPYGDVYVYTPYLSSGILWIDGIYYYDIIYLNDTAYDEFNKFLAGEYFSLALSDSFSHLSAMNDNDLSTIKGSTDARTLDVRELSSLDIYEIYAYDKTGAIYQTIGAIYVTHDNEYLYIDYTLLSNNYFDADGYFSYRNGEVTAKVLNSDGISTINELIDELEYPDYNYTYEDNSESDFSDVLIVLFWIFLIGVGIILPIIVIGISAFLPPFLERKRKRRIMSFVEATGNNGANQDFSPEIEKPRRKISFTPWTLAAILSSVWLILGIIFIFIIIL